MIALNRTVGVFFALWVLYLRRLPLYVPDIKFTALPASANLVATACQYEALYYIRFPEQTLMKTLKVIPVMLCGRILRNRIYQPLEYIEALMLTGIISFFVYYFSLDNIDLRGVDGNIIGIVLMCGYLTFDSLT